MMAATHLPTHPLAERLEHQPRHNVFFVLIVPTRLHRLCRCRPPAETSFPKLAERNLQEIVRVIPPFGIGIVVFRCGAAAIVALPLLLPNEQCADVDRGHGQHTLPWLPDSLPSPLSPPLPPPPRPPSLQRSRGGGSHLQGGGGRCPGSVGGEHPPISCTPPPLLPQPLQPPLPTPSPSPLPTWYCRECSSSPRPSVPSHPTERAVVPPECPPRHVVVDDCASDGPPHLAVMAMRPDGGGGVGGGKNGVSGGSSMDRDNKDHNADGNRRCRPCPRQVATAVGMMMMVGKRGGKATMKRLQGDDEVTEM